MQFLWRVIDYIVGKGLDWTVIAEFLGYACISLVPMSLPLAILLAALMSFGSMGENYELTALKASGISLWRIMIPLIAFVTIVSIGAFFFSNNIMPYSNLKSRTLLRDIRNKRPDIDIKAGAFYNEIPDYSIRIGKKDTETGLLKDLLIYDHRENRGNTKITVADSGYMMSTPDKKNIIFKLYSGESYTEIADKKEDKRKRIKHYQHRRDKFDEQTTVTALDINLERSDGGSLKTNYDMLNTSQLMYTADSLQKILTDKEANFKDNLIGKILKKDKGRTTDTNYDSLKRINILEQYNTLAVSQKKQAIEEALQLAKANKTTVSNQKKGLMYRKRLINRYYNEWHRKFTLSAACFVFFFIGAPLGAIIRKGGLGLPTVIAVIFFIFYYMITLTGDKFGRQGVLTPMAGMWLSTFIIFPVGAFLTYKATSDSSLFNTEMYTNKLKRFFRINKLLIKKARHRRKLEH